MVSVAGAVLQFGHEPVPDVDRVGPALDVGGEDDELVATDAGHGVVWPNDGGQLLGHTAQHGVPHRMTLRVVDLLEPIEIDEQHRRAGRERLAASSATGRSDRPGVSGSASPSRHRASPASSRLPVRPADRPSVRPASRRDGRSRGPALFCPLRSVNVRQARLSPSISRAEIPTRTGTADPRRAEEGRDGSSGTAAGRVDPLPQVDPTETCCDDLCLGLVEREVHGRAAGTRRETELRREGGLAGTRRAADEDGAPLEKPPSASIGVETGDAGRHAPWPRCAAAERVTGRHRDAGFADEERYSFVPGMSRGT